MGSSCIYVASASLADHAIILGSLTIAVIGYRVLLNLRARRLETAPVNDGETLAPEVSMARA